MPTARNINKLYEHNCCHFLFVCALRCILTANGPSIFCYRYTSPTPTLNFNFTKTENGKRRRTFRSYRTWSASLQYAHECILILITLNVAHYCFSNCVFAKVDKSDFFKKQCPFCSQREWRPQDVQNIIECKQTSIKCSEHHGTHKDVLKTSKAL